MLNNADAKDFFEIAMTRAWAVAVGPEVRASRLWHPAHNELRRAPHERQQHATYEAAAHRTSAPQIFPAYSTPVLTALDDTTHRIGGYGSFQEAKEDAVGKVVVHEALDGQLV